MSSREFFTVVELSRALNMMLDHVPQLELAAETIPVDKSLGRYLARAFAAPEEVPPFKRSIMDGYAVRSGDTYGATAGSPVYLDLAGSVTMGAATSLHVGPGQAVAIPTGGMMPEEADAVVMVEHTAPVDASMLEISRAVASGENVVTAGEDFRRGDTILARGHRIRPQDLGALAALGQAEIAVCRRIRIGILSTGDEIIPVEASPAPGQLRDVNYHALAGLVELSGSIPVSLGICPDDADMIREHLEEGIRSCDIVIVSGGSSVGAADVAPEVINALGQPGILVHGLAIKPGKPTIIAVADGVPVFGLPGHPVSAFDVFNSVVVRLIGYFYTGEISAADPLARIKARLARNLASISGREDRVRVYLENKEGEVWANPIMGKSGLISLLVRADGVAVIPFESEGVARGDEVFVDLFI